ncbi:unnamed protein product, partial [Rotaria sp. Silwood2]
MITVAKMAKNSALILSFRIVCEGLDGALLPPYFIVSYPVGPVSFRNRQRHAETLISQFQIDLRQQQQQIQTIAEYSHVLGLNIKCSTCRTLIWPGSIPVDTERSEVRRLVMNIVEIGLITTSCILGLALAIFFLTFNIINRHQR